MGGVFREKGAEVSRRAGMSQPDSRGPLIEALRQHLGKWGVAKAEEAPAFSCGAEAVDRLLPSGGLRHGMLVEWVGVAAGGSPAEESNAKQRATKSVRARGGPPAATHGAITLGLLAAREACREGGVLVVIDRARTFYPPAAAAWGVDLGRLIVVWPQNARDELWAAVQALRSPVVAAVWASIDRLDGRAFRRLQLAAEEGRTLGALVRPPSARGRPTWAEVRLEISPLSVVRGPLYGSNGRRTTDHGRFIQVRLGHCHNGRAGGSAMLEIDDMARTVRQMSSTDVPHSLPVVTQLAHSASRSLPARA